ncbi:MAG: siroheme synthase CysG [Beijerinckiaceae bacterium]
MNIVSRKPSEASPNRLSALARLPVFLDLNGRTAVLAGGSAGAAWKAELLAAAGASVQIFAEDASEEMLQLVERGAASGSLTLHRRRWTATDFATAAIAVGDCDNEAEAQGFRAAAQAAGVPCNTIDRRETCDFEFGSIVNRSPVVIGVSTNGAAPILAQNIRRRIETLLPASLSGWAALARDIRRSVMDRLAMGAPRREFWERFSDRALGGGPPPATPSAVEGLIEEVRAGDARQGRVTLVGAGPGDAELLTLKAVRALQAADVILFDDLVSDDVLELARREAKRMMVGKRARSASCSQADINDLMLKLARQGRHVVRLKSGDPMIFGRAGEEIASLEAAGVPVDVVPGVSTANALAASLGVSLTHRDVAQSVRFVTGHARTGELPDDLDWRGLADQRTSLVFYMGGRTGPRIARRLLSEGLASSTPVIVAWAVSRAGQGHRSTTLAELAGEESASQAGQPTILCIGAAFAQAMRKRDADAVLKSA